MTPLRLVLSPADVTAIFINLEVRVPARSSPRQAQAPDRLGRQAGPKLTVPRFPGSCVPARGTVGWCCGVLFRLTGRRGVAPLPSENFGLRRQEDEVSASFRGLPSVLA